MRLFVSIRKCFDKDSRCPTERKGCGKVDWEQRIVKTKLRYHQFVLSGGNESYIIRVSVREKHQAVTSEDPGIDLCLRLNI